MNIRTDDLRIRDIRELTTPETLMREFALTERASATVAAGRAGVQGILHGRDDRLAVVIGPCSIHDTKAAMEYASRLLEQREKFKDTLEIVMRVYFEKPRTTVGWKGLINDPDLDGSFHAFGRVTGRHTDVDDRHIRCVPADEVDQLVGVACLADHLQPGFGEDPSCPFSEEQPVVGQNHPHGISARSVVPVPSGLVTKSRPSSVVNLSASP